MGESRFFNFAQEWAIPGSKEIGNHTIHLIGVIWKSPLNKRQEEKTVDHFICSISGDGADED